MIKKYRNLSIAGFLLLSMSSAFASIYAKWDGINPIKVGLNLNQERIVTVEGYHMQVGLPASLEGIVSTQSVGNSVYLTSNKVFDTARVQLKDVQTNKIILIDLFTEDKGSDFHYEDIQVKVSNKSSLNKSTTSPRPAKRVEANSHYRQQLPTPAALTRYASQSLYAPIRAIEPLAGVFKVSIKGIPRNIPQILPSLPISAKPLVAFGLDDYVVTAVKIKNLSNERITLDPRFLQGKYVAATFQHNTLGISGFEDDTTVVYLITIGKLTKSKLSY